MYYDHRRSNGKNSKFYYYAVNFGRMAVPDAFCRRRLEGVLAKLDARPDREYILSRVDYYNKLTPPAPLQEGAPRLADFKLKGSKSTYFFDTREFSRWFDPSLRWNYLFGDITKVPPRPTILKSRPVAGDNANSVLLNLDKVRHFNFLRDKKKFTDKADRAIFRGEIADKPHRIAFMEKYYGDPAVDAGMIYPVPPFPPEWAREPISLWDHLDYKFILALEGTDVASNLKWIMSTNSLAVMPRPTYETWFMEGTLVPGEHYVEIRADFADLKEKMEYYASHPAEAEDISRNAHEYIRQFLDPERERLVSLLVLDKYFRATGQE